MPMAGSAEARVLEELDRETFLQLLRVSSAALRSSSAAERMPPA